MKKKLFTPLITAILILFCSVAFAQQEICGGDVEQYDVTQTSGSTYEWEVLEGGFAGTITGNDTNEIEIDWANTPVGTYTLQVTEMGAGGCEGDPVQITVTINETPTAPVVTITQPTCTTQTGSFEVTSPVGSGLEYSIDGGNNYQTATTFNNLTPGTYQVIARNAAGCISESTNVIIDPAPAAPADATVSVTQPNCGDAGGTIEITAPTGSGLEYSIDGGNNYSSATTYNDLPAGDYDVIVKNADGCESGVINVTIDPAPAAPADPTVAEFQPECGETTGSIEITAPTGSSGLEYSIDGGNTYQTNPLFTDVAPGTYDVVVKDTSSGCESNTVSATINSAPAAPQTSPINYN
ncbi:hypothetical protein [Mesonia maritima]|uniref:SprB repeat-containing protein n=1 Tax=Mesonia maritima TaxID=1793873 RepID=A0ABU1K8H8_9FLAO|nr:hypothetical protein [Mesonia maritima]MDR6301924.1 hypothetical protein [Mesonia maritima]